jgi:signal transduction histidine kinase
VITTATLGWALFWSVIASAAVWLALYPLLRRSLTGVFASVVLTGTAASIGALLGGAHEMLLPMRHWAAMLALTVAAGAIATAAAWLAARRLMQDNRQLRAAIADLAAGRVPSSSGRPLTAELESLRAELTTTARALGETRERERALESSRRELVAWVSHDLRTPLAGLRAMTEALEDGLVEDPHLYYKQIAASTDRLNAMVDDLFELSRLQSGSLTHSTEPVSLEDVASDCVAALVPLAADKGVSLAGRSSAHVPLLGNAAELTRAITNLVANAIRYCAPAGSVVVEVGRSTDGGFVSVSDECGGIPAADLPRVFDVGFRGEAARTPEPDNGTHAGLGLAIAKGIVEAHGGELAVHNTELGCRFTMTFPELLDTSPAT